MKSVLVATFFCVIFFVSNGFSQYCGDSRLRIKFTFDEPTEPPTEVSYQLYFVVPPNKEKIKKEEIFDFAAMFYYGKLEEYPGCFFKKYRNQDFLRVPKAKAETYIENYRAADYESFFSKFDKDLKKQMSGQSAAGILTFHTFELEDTPFLMKAEAVGFEPIYLFSNFWGGCYKKQIEETIQMKRLKSSSKK